MKILHLDIEGGYGGSSRSLTILVANLQRLNVVSEVWHAKKGPSNEKLLYQGILSKINKNIVSIIPLQKNNIKNILFLFFKLFRLFKLANEIIENNADILHLNYNGLLPLCLLLKKKGYRKKIIVHSRTIFPNNLFGRVYSKLYNLTDANIFISSEEMNNIKFLNKKVLNKPFSILNNCAPDNLFKDKITIDDKKKLRIIFLGTIDYLRAPDRIIELAKITKKMSLRVKYYIFGNEGYKSKLSNKEIVNYSTIKHKIKHLKLSDTVIFKGFTKNPEKEIINADILIRPARKGDCWGRDVIEAMAAGLFIIASGKKEVFIKNNFNGLLFQTWNSKEIAEILRNYLKDKKLFLKIKKNARKYAKKKFFAKQHANDFYKFAYALLKKNI